MSRALCFRTEENQTAQQFFEALSQDPTKTAPFRFVDRSICEDPANGWLQLIPYVSIYNFTPATGLLKIVKYNRPTKGEGEARLRAKTSVGFGGHIDQDSDIVCSLPPQDGVFMMNVGDVLRTVQAAGRREVQEELGVDVIEVFGVTSDNITYTLIHEENPDEVGSVHTGMSIKIQLNDEQLPQLFDQLKSQETEIENISVLALNIDKILMSFDVPNVTKHLVQHLTEEQSTENWTNNVIVQHLAEIVDFFQKHTTYQDILAAIRNRFSSAEIGNETDEEDSSVDSAIQQATEAATAQVAALEAQAKTE